MVVDGELEPSDTWVGQVLGDRYEILECIGYGGMGLVFRARHVELGRQFAVKVLQRQFTRDTVWVERFRREARATTAIGHENIIDITDIGVTPEGSLYYVMEHLRGENLSAMLAREGPLPWSRVRGIALQLCDALAAVHDAGIVHRDLKLSNIFRVARPRNPDFIKVLDFGIAKTLTWEPGPGKLTATGETFGTPGYMAPEQICGGTIDARTDLYSTAVMLYQLLAGVKPFTGSSPELVVQQQFTRPPAPIAGHIGEHDVPPHVEAVLCSALAPDPGHRPADIRAFAALLFAEPLPPPAPVPALVQAPDEDSTDATLPRVRPPEPPTHPGAHPRPPSPWILIVPALAVLGLTIATWAALRDDPRPHAAVTPAPVTASEPAVVPPTPTPPAPPVDPVPELAAPPVVTTAAPASPPAAPEETPAAAPAPAVKRAPRPVHDTLASGFERHWPAIQSCLCKYYHNFPPSSITVKLRLDPTTRKLLGELEGGGAQARTCVVSGLQRSRALTLGPGAATSDTVARRPVCR